MVEQGRTNKSIPSCHAVHPVVLYVSDKLLSVVCEREKCVGERAEPTGRHCENRKAERKNAIGKIERDR